MAALMPVLKKVEAIIEEAGFKPLMIEFGDPVSSECMKVEYKKNLKDSRKWGAKHP